MKKYSLLFLMCFLLISSPSVYADEPSHLVSKSGNSPYHNIGSYTVQSHDTLWGISFLFHIPVATLKEINHLTDDQLVTGQILKVSKTQKLKGKTVVVDAGHGGLETGAFQNGIQEKDETVNVSSKLKKHLENEGAKVVMTVDKLFPKFKILPLSDRARISKTLGADAFVSIHFNSNPNETVNGTEVYYNQYPYKNTRNPYPEESRELSESILHHLVYSIETTNLGVKENDFHVLRNNSVPSTLVEVGFISNTEEATHIKTNTFKEKAAFGISQGIIDYFNSKNP